MCGIVGIVTENAQDYRSIVSKMCKTLHHRGPDDSGIVCFDNAIIAHTRLSIVDIEGGWQPKKVGSVGVTFNGEIYGGEIGIILDGRGRPFSLDIKTKNRTKFIIYIWNF